MAGAAIAGMFLCASNIVILHALIKESCEFRTDLFFSAFRSLCLGGIQKSQL